MKHTARLWFVPLLFLFASALAAQEMCTTDGPTVVRAARMLDVESGAMVPNPVLVVEDGRITAINPSRTPSGAREMDLVLCLQSLFGFVDLGYDGIG